MEVLILAVSLNTEYLKDFIDESEYSAIDSQVRLVQALLRSGAGEGHSGPHRVHCFNIYISEDGVGPCCTVD